MYTSSKCDITFVLIEKSFIIQQGLLHLLNEFGSLQCLEIIEDYHIAYERILQLKPDFVIMNTRFMPEYDQDIKSKFPTDLITRFIAFTECVVPMAQGHSFDAVLRLSDSGIALTENLRQLFDNTNGREDADKNEDLSEREKDVIKCVANGLTNKEIADKLFISIHTVITHRKNITRKLGIKSVSGLTVYALLNKLVSMDEIDS